GRGRGRRRRSGRGVVRPRFRRVARIGGCSGDRRVVAPLVLRVPQDEREGAFVRRRSRAEAATSARRGGQRRGSGRVGRAGVAGSCGAWSRPLGSAGPGDRKSTRLNSSHVAISYAVFCLKKKNRHSSERESQWSRGRSGLNARDGRLAGG